MSKNERRGGEIGVENHPLWETIDVAENERALIFRRNRLDSVLETGHHRISQLNGKVRIEIHRVTDILSAEYCVF